MFTRIVSGVVSAFICVAFSIPANTDQTFSIQQPDGTYIVLKQWGDEFLSGFETTDGYTVIKDTDGFYKYVVLGKDGKLKASANRAGIDPPPQIRKHLRPSNSAIIQRINTLRAQVYAKVVSPTGTGKLPVVLITFDDQGSPLTTTYTASDFNNLIFGSGSNSMKKYYEEVSYGVFTIAGEVKGWYKASQGHDYYGADDSNSKDIRVRELVREAAQLADNDINFAQYDTDGDCFVDVLGVVHQGRGQEESGTLTDIWSHRWWLASPYETNDNCPSGGKIKIRDYIIMPETLGQNNSLSTIGVFTHEYGHALGLPDLYDTDGSSRGIGRWGLMGNGGWLGSPPGSSPAHLSAWSKAKLGWVTPRLIYSVQTDMVIEPVENNKNHVFQLVVGEAGKYGEYFLIENRQKIGFDGALPAEGLLIWHIDESVSNNRSECTGDHGSGSCSSSHYKVALEQADGQFDLDNDNNNASPGDPFPTSSNNAFTNTSTPSSKFYSGDLSGVRIYNIRRSGDNIIVNIDDTTVYPDIQVSTTELDFGVVGADDEYMSVTVSNMGNYKLRFKDKGITGSSIFEINYTSTCGQKLNPSESCVIEIKAQNRNNLGAQRATLTIKTDDPDEPVVGVALKSSALPVESGAGCNAGGGLNLGALLLVGVWGIRFVRKRLILS